jgi:hypothetical protein
LPASPTCPRAAVEEGILPGGGVALLRAAEALKRVRTSGEQSTNRRMVLSATIEGSHDQIRISSAHRRAKSASLFQFNESFTRQAAAFLASESVFAPY